jgi:hypothetical protein
MTHGGMACTSRASFCKIALFVKFGAAASACRAPRRCCFAKPSWKPVREEAIVRARAAARNPLRLRVGTITAGGVYTAPQALPLPATVEDKWYMAGPYMLDSFTGNKY